MVEPFALSETLSWDKFLILSQDLERGTTDEKVGGFSRRRGNARGLLMTHLLS